jgi:hypothetical protein
VRLLLPPPRALGGREGADIKSDSHLRGTSSFRADLLDRHDKGDRSGSQIDKRKVYAVRVKDLQADAKDLVELTKLIFKLANPAVEKRPDKREQLRHELSNDAQNQEVIA